MQKEPGGAAVELACCKAKIAGYKRPRSFLRERRDATHNDWENPPPPTERTIFWRTKRQRGRARAAVANSITSEKMGNP